MVVHRIFQVAEEETRNARHDPKRDGDDIHVPDAVREGLFERDDARADDAGVHAGDLGQGGDVVAREGFNEGHQGSFREAGLERGGGDVRGDLYRELVVDGGGVDGGEDGGGDGARGGGDGGGGGDEVVRRGELDAGDDQHERGAEADPGEPGEDDRAGAVGGLDGCEADDAGGQDREADEERQFDGAQLGAGVAVEDGAEAARDPEGLAAGDFEEGVGCE